MLKNSVNKLINIAPIEEQLNIAQINEFLKYRYNRQTI